jgi:uncharacterized protein YndB with AHSA1/START domain
MNRPCKKLTAKRKSSHAQSMKRDIRIQRVFPHPIQQVWRALTDARILGSWFMENDFAPTMHHQFTFRKPPQRGWDGITHCEVLELEPQIRVAYSYRGRATGEKTLSCAGIESERVQAAAKGIFTELDTVLRFTLTPVRGSDGTESTRLLLEHTGFSGLKLVLVSFVMGAGWKKILSQRLSAALAEHTLNP